MSNIPIFLSSDNNYAPFVATTMASILSNTNSFIEFYILDGGITTENVEKIQSLKSNFSNFSIEFIKIYYEKYLKNFKEIGHWNKSVYARFLIPDLKTQINKAIYLDVDIIVTGDITNLYNEDLEDYALGAVWEQWAEDGINKQHKIRMRLSDKHKYFNTGVLLINSNKWREENIQKHLSDISNKFNDRIKMVDQDILNKYFDNNYKVLEQKYNYLTTNFYVNDTQELYIIRHLTGNVRPWQLNPTTASIVPNVKDFWYYAKMTPFYDELLSKTLDINNQKQLCRLAIIEKNIWRTQAKDKHYNEVKA